VIQNDCGEIVFLDEGEGFAIQIRLSDARAGLLEGLCYVESDQRLVLDNEDRAPLEIGAMHGASRRG
jgi:hypothetical protein